MTRILAVDNHSPTVQKVSTYALESEGYLFVIVEDNKKKESASGNANLEMMFSGSYMFRMNERSSAKSLCQFNHHPFKPLDSEKRLRTLYSALN